MNNYNDRYPAMASSLHKSEKGGPEEAGTPTPRMLALVKRAEDLNVVLKRTLYRIEVLQDSLFGEVNRETCKAEGSTVGASGSVSLLEIEQAKMAEILGDINTVLTRLERAIIG